MGYETALAASMWLLLAVLIFVGFYPWEGKKKVFRESDCEPKYPKVTFDDGETQRIFVPWGDMNYKRDTFIHEEPALPGERWRKRTRTVHTLTWETVSYE